MTRVLLIGARGQLGVDLAAELSGEYEIVPVTQEIMPVEDAARVRTCVAENNPRIIVNCSAFHRVDDCETQVEQAFRINVYGLRNLALAARECGALLVSFSTDYVFDGARRTPYVEDDSPTPKSIYGVSKAAGEIMLRALYDRYFMIRTCGLYGYAGSREKKTNFVESMIGWARQGKPLRIVCDQVCTPTPTLEVARAVRNLLAREDYGLYHLTCAGECSWYEFATAIFEMMDLHPAVSPVPSSEFPTPAKRPGYSVLDNRRYRSLGFQDLPHWRDALRSYIDGRAANGRA